MITDNYECIWRWILLSSVTSDNNSMSWKSLINYKNWPFRFCTSLKQYAMVCLKYYSLLPPYFLKERWSSVSTNSLGPFPLEFPVTAAWSEVIEVTVKVQIRWSLKDPSTTKYLYLEFWQYIRDAWYCLIIIIKILTITRSMDTVYQEIFYLWFTRTLPQHNEHTQRG